MKLKMLLPLCVMLLLVPLVYADPVVEEKTCVAFFYGVGCPHCGRIEPYLKYLGEKHPGLYVEEFEVYYERANLIKLQEYFEAFNVPDYDRGVPVAFINGRYLVGDKPIIEGLEPFLMEFEGAPCPLIEEIEAEEDKDITGVAAPASPVKQFPPRFLLTIIGAAIVDSINPCAIAVLLILLAALFATGGKARALKAGLAFTVSIYIIYFLFGVGLFSAIRVSGLSYMFYQVVGYIAIVIGLFNIKDFFWYGGCGFVMEIPRRWRPTLQGLLRKVTSPLGAFLMGFVVCLFELPCTGGPYLFVLGLLAEKTTRLYAIPVLLLYNLFFILPLLLITLMVYVGFTNVEKATEWKERNVRKLHLIAGIIMISLGLAVVPGFI